MGSGMEMEYQPDAARAEQYRALYERYSKLGEYVENEILSMRKKP